MTETAPTDLAEPSAAELVEGYAAGDFTPVEATEAALARIEERDGDLNAFVLVDRDSAIASAQASGSALEGGGDPGCRRRRAHQHQRHLPDRRVADASRLQPCGRGRPLGHRRAVRGSAARIRRSAAGQGDHTGVRLEGDDRQHPLRRHRQPLGPSTTAGGSSGGSSASVGAGMGAWSVGTDAGGSVRIPASFTGTVALKPTYGLVPMYPASPFGTLAHAGPMTRTVTDTAMLMDVIAGFDPRDWSALPTPNGSFTRGLEDGVEGLRIAYSPTLGYRENDPEVEQQVRQAVEVLKSLGAVVDEVDPGFADPIEHFHVLWFTGANKVVSAYGAGALDKVDPGLRAGIEEYSDATAMDFLDATQTRMDLGVQMGIFHQEYDLLVTPTMPITAFDRNRQAPPGWKSDLWTTWTPYTYPFNMTQQPAASVPCGVTAEGLPVGLQFVAARTQDRMVLQAARAYEKASGEQYIRPVAAKAG